MRERVRQWGLIGLLSAVAVMSSGCGMVSLNTEYMDNGLVVVLPGIDGPGLGTLGLMTTVADNTELAVGQFDWTLPFGMLLNQTAQWRNRDMGKVLAKKIVAYDEKYPGRPVYLVGHSGGTAIAVWAAEALPPEVKVEGIILLASSLSPGYDLSRALANTRGQIVSVYSAGDSALLGAGTSLIGTMDGVHGQSAGKVGFTPRGGRWGYDGRLVQIPWTPGMRKLGYSGDHFSCCSSGFVAEYLVPVMNTQLSQAALAALPDYMVPAR